MRVCVHIQEDHQESLYAHLREPPGEFVCTSKRTIRRVCVHIQEDHQESLCAHPRGPLGEFVCKSTIGGSLCAHPKGPSGEFVCTSKMTIRGVCVHIHDDHQEWLSNGLHHLWCGAGKYYFLSEECACKFCGCAGVDKFHLLRCEWTSCEQMNRDNIQQIVKVLHARNRHT